jgi:cytochrome b subunit of formate dehydrogenase
MRPARPRRWRLLLITLGFAVILTGWPAPAPAQEEVTSSLRRYRDREASTGYYEEYEAKPRRTRPFVGVPGVLRKPFPYSPQGAEIRTRTHLADSHQGIKFYEMRRCEECHAPEANHSHTVRGNVTCRQCHGGEPIASINHYYSPLNPIRRHSYVCAKCHEGSSASFATYQVHEPKAGDPATRKSFPALYWGNRFMYLLIVGVFAFFLPHSVLWVIREFFSQKKGAPQDAERQPEIKRFNLADRLFHLFVMVTFTVQALTGVGRLLYITNWGKWFVGFFGGYESATIIHNRVGVIMIVGFIAHIVYVLARMDWRGFPQSLFSDDSLIPNLTDFKNLGQLFRWFFGMGPPARFGRWTYWEKFDYWAVFWGMPLFAVTGLMLMYPVATSRILPGWTLNVALLFHRAEAILAIGYLFFFTSWWATSAPAPSP